ncbi:MAG TPA: antitoxin [Mycobacteriales bacterium]|nr:antitoxin [Mycobacteriales bacterium]
MARRTQIILDEEQYRLLKAESSRSGASLGALVRAAVDQRFGRAAADSAAALEALERSAGVWSDLAEDGAAYVDSVRRGRWRTDPGEHSEP